ncbi:hypothetical protein Psch_00294 [Pelotomaculum schinkii]|uniref:Uncharacterized protein n=1 Tax=Pelotomaculum schinkii TaxID=78350 RepID=A0A4Y7RDI3_9FIRM|nr:MULTISPECIES: hypothetical protein [Pelotomaculum]TEB06762.1 hypothetical protein Psch_00294 [Pelotomaculum schinkii]TEB16596.1 hypothetical protein Psfp_01206 [Pelotomaculum sp. FP]
MEESRTAFDNKKLHFNYYTDTTKYYLLTGGSGYPLADFDFSNIPSLKQTSFVIPKK